MSSPARSVALLLVLQISRSSPCSAAQHQSSLRTIGIDHNPFEIYQPPFFPSPQEDTESIWKFDFPLKIKSRFDKLNYPLKTMSAKEKIGCNPPPLLTVYLWTQLKKITFSNFQFGIHNSLTLVGLAKSRNLLFT